MNVTSSNLTSKPFTTEDLEKAMKILKPRKIAIIGNKEVYDKLLELPNIDSECIKYCPWIPDGENKSYIIDMDKIEQDIWNACKIPKDLI